MQWKKRLGEVWTKFENGRLGNIGGTLCQLCINFVTIFVTKFVTLFWNVCQYLRHMVDIPVYCFNIFRSAFGLLFCLLDRKLILGSTPIWQVWESINVQLEVWGHFLRQKIDISKCHFFLKTAHWYVVWNFFDNPFMRSENLKSCQKI